MQKTEIDFNLIYPYFVLTWIDRVSVTPNLSRRRKELIKNNTGVGHGVILVIKPKMLK